MVSVGSPSLLWGFQCSLNIHWMWLYVCYLGHEYWLNYYTENLIQMKYFINKVRNMLNKIPCHLFGANMKSL